MKSYTAEHARNDLQVIEWLLSSGAIKKEDACYLRMCVQKRLA